MRTGLEPATPCVTGMYSNQLNYRTWLFCECKDIGYFLYLQIFRQLFFEKVQISLFGGQKPGVWKIFRRKEIKNSEKIWWFGKSALSLQRFSDEESVKLGLSYGVMVALQFLVLPVLVRVRIRQLKERWTSALFFLFGRARLGATNTFCFGRKEVCDKEQRVIGAAVSLRAKSPARRLQREYIERFMKKISHNPQLFKIK